MIDVNGIEDCTSLERHLNDLEIEERRIRSLTLPTVMRRLEVIAEEKQKLWDMGVVSIVPDED